MRVIKSNTNISIKLAIICNIEVTNQEFLPKIAKKDCSQCVRMDLNKRSGPEQKTITASKGTP